ncbi:MAG: hypothetical protein ACRC7O_03825 [Fimbriiglobus sp.]
MKRMMWVLPTAALAVGVYALVPGASALTTDAAVVTTTAANGSNSLEIVNGQDWQAMAGTNVVVPSLTIGKDSATGTAIGG